MTDMKEIARFTKNGTLKIRVSNLIVNLIGQMLRAE